MCDSKQAAWSTPAADIHICFATYFHILTSCVFLVAPQTKHALTSTDVVLTLRRVLNITSTILLTLSALGLTHPLVRVIPGVEWPGAWP